MAYAYANTAQLAAAYTACTLDTAYTTSVEALAHRAHGFYCVCSLYVADTAHVACAECGAHAAGTVVIACIAYAAQPRAVQNTHMSKPSHKNPYIISSPTINNYILTS